MMMERWSREALLALSPLEKRCWTLVSEKECLLRPTPAHVALQTRRQHPNHSLPFRWLGLSSSATFSSSVLSKPA